MAGRHLPPPGKARYTLLSVCSLLLLFVNKRFAQTNRSERTDLRLPRWGKLDRRSAYFTYRIYVAAETDEVVLVQKTLILGTTSSVAPRVYICYPSFIGGSTPSPTGEGSMYIAFRFFFAITFLKPTLRTNKP